MTYMRKKCPYCKGAYYVRYEKELGRANHYTSPICTCKSCNQTFIDKELREIALDGIRPGDQARVSTSTIVLALIGALIFLGGLLVGKMYLAAGILALGYSIWSVREECRSYEKRMEYLRQETAASEERVKDPVYILRLAELGYRVPDGVLSAAMQGDRGDQEEPL